MRQPIGGIIGRSVRPVGCDWRVRDSFHGGMLTETEN